MNLSKVKAAGGLVMILGFILWLVVFMRRGTGRILLLLGATSSALAALTQVCQLLQIFPAMGWDLPRSPGYYLGLDSALAGLVLLTAGLRLALQRRVG